MRPEAALWDFVRPYLPNGIHYSRIESLETSPGFPDVHYTLQGHSGTVELKAQPTPKGKYPFQGEKKGLRQSQKNWIRDELEARGHVIICLQARDTILFLPGCYYTQIDNMTLSNLHSNAELIWEKSGVVSPTALKALLLNL